MEKIYVQDLLDMVKKLEPYKATLSHSIVKEFKQSYPKQEKPEFKHDWTGASGKS